MIKEQRKFENWIAVQEDQRLREGLKGSVSHGTMLFEDLIRALIPVLAKVKPEDAEKFEKEYLSIQKDDEDAKYWILDDLFDALNDIALPGYYFGTREGDGADGADYGFWESDDYAKRRQA